MAKSGSFLESKAFKSIMAKVYGLGAAVVIVGALFKLMHWPGAGIMLIVGLGTEALIFAISAFEPLKHDIDWTLVYPELAGMEGKDKKGDKKKSMTEELDRMLEEAKIEKDLIGKLGEGMKSFSDNVSKMNDISEASVATSEYTNNVRQAADTVNKLNDSYSSALMAIEALSETSNASKEYFEQMQNASKSMSNLNETYQEQFNELNNNIKQLNSVYGNMLSAMGGNPNS